MAVLRIPHGCHDFSLDLKISLAECTACGLAELKKVKSAQNAARHQHNSKRNIVCSTWTKIDFHLHLGTANIDP